MEDPNAPNIPTIAVTPPTCSANGTASITNHIPGATYTFNPTGPNVDGSGNITGFTSGTAYTVTVTHNGCTSDPSSSFTILGILPTPTLSTSFTNPTTCGGNGTIELTFTNVSDGNYTVNYDGGSFTNVAVNGGVATVNAPAGTYSNLVITNSEGCASATGENVTLEDPNAPNIPTIAVTPPTCSANGTASITNHIPGATYTFNPTGPNVDGSGNITDFTSGTAYTVTATESGCTSSIANFTVEGMLPTPTVSASFTNPTTCGGDGTIDFTFTNVDDGSYTINYDGDDFTNVTVNGGVATVNAPAGTYSNLVITNSEGCASATGENVTLVDPNVPDAPIVNTNAADCDNDGTASISNYDSDYTYNFTPTGPIINGNGNITNLTSGTAYTVTVTHNGCTSDPSSSFTILGILPTPTLSTSFTNPTTCGGDGTIELTFTNVSDGNYTVNYDGGSFTNVAVNGGTATVNAPAGTYNDLTITNADGCTSSNGVNATLEDPNAPDAPIVNVVAPTCSANGTASISNHIPGPTYTFNPAGPNVSGGGNIGGGISYGTAYTVTVTHNGCTSNSSVSFTIEGMQSASNIDVTATNSEVCQGEPVVLTASGGVSYSWNTGSTDESITVHPTATTTYTVTGTDANGCESTAQVTITVNPLPVVDAGNDIELCIADGIVLTAYNPDGATITWNNGVSEGVPFTQTENTVTYTVTAELNGCTSTDQVTVSISSSLSDVEIATYYEVCLGRQAVIAVNNPIQGYTYSWYYGGIMVGTGSALTINNTSKYDEGQYTLFVENQNGCFEEFDITLNVIDCGVQIPEAFSPNGDGINDYFHIGNLEAYPKSELWIYNRWGIEVYHAENY